MGIRASVEVVVLLLGATLALATLARRLGIPYPIFLTLGGLLLGLVPGLPEVVLAPDLVLLLVLPPLLYAAAWDTSWRDFKSNRRVIALLALGLVFTTVVSVAVVAHAFIGLDWATAFALGAIVSPTDTLAATTIMERLHVPRRLVAILEGESLVNDASGLVAYRFAVAAALTGGFSLLSAAGHFALLALGGVLVGAAVGLVQMKILARLDERPVEILGGLVGAYAAYLLAERLGVSGVLACVSTGLVGSRLAPRVVRSSTRLDAYAFWETLEFLLNGLVFILLGFQARGVWREISDAPRSLLALYGLAVSLTVVATRLLWVFPAAWLPRVLSRRLRARDPHPGWRPLVTIGWTGMRGAVALALALALPRDDAAFPARGLIVYLTFCVILFTLVGQGLTLPPLLRRLGMTKGGGDRREELEARRSTARAGLGRVENLLDEPWAPPREAGEHLVGHYQERLRTLNRADMDGGAADGEALDAAASRGLQRLRLQGVDAERRELIRLRNAGAIDDDVFHRLERDLDLEEQRP